MGETQPGLNSCFEPMLDNSILAPSAEQGGNGSGTIMLWSPQTDSTQDQICVSVFDPYDYKEERFLALKWILYSFQDPDLAVMRKNDIRGKHSYKLISFVES